MTQNEIKDLVRGYDSDLVYMLERLEKLERVAVDAKLLLAARGALLHKKAVEALNISFILLDK